MRRSPLTTGVGLAISASLLIGVTGCKGFEQKSAAPVSAATSSSARSTGPSTESHPSTESRPSTADTPFCTAAGGLVAATDPSSGDTSDPEKAAAFFQQAARKLRSVTPPAAIAPDWSAVADGLAELSKAYAGTDLSNVQEEQQLELTITRVQTSIGPAQNRVNDYLHASCGIDTGGGTVSTPTVSAPVLVPPPTPSPTR